MHPHSIESAGLCVLGCARHTWKFRQATAASRQVRLPLFNSRQTKSRRGLQSSGAHQLESQKTPAPSCEPPCSTSQPAQHDAKCLMLATMSTQK